MLVSQISEFGLIYITDSELGQIQVFNSQGNYQFTIKGYFERPTGHHHPHEKIGKRHVQHKREP